MTDERVAAIPVTPVSRADLPAWLEAHAGCRPWVERMGFKGEPGSFVFVPGRDGRPERVLAAPCEDAAVWGFAGLPTALPAGTYVLEGGLDAAAATDAALGWSLGAYAFAAYRQPERVPAKLVWPERADRTEVERIAASVYVTRDLINTPAQDMGPDELTEAGSAIARRAGAKTRIVRGDALLKENYPAIHAVGRASARAPALLDFVWGNANAPKVTLVGKGVCFDTGGLDIKPHEGMLEMKKDMGGGAVVLGLARALMAANVPVRLRVLVPAVENAISGNAMRPRDIIRTRSGKTVEIGHTDAEGRLILCDALAEAGSEAPDLLIDCATLTGAARVALGPEIAALFSDDESLASELQQTGARVGDPLWRMPLWRPYRKQLDGRCADLNNMPKGPFAGSIYGALFLAEFVSAARSWAHLDIMAMNVAARPGRPEGGEATGLRVLDAYIRGRFG